MNDFVWGGWGGWSNTVSSEDASPQPQGIFANPHSEFPYPMWFDFPFFDLPSAREEASLNSSSPWEDPSLDEWVDLSKD